MSMKQVMLLIGTRKGGFLAFADESRKEWTIKGPFFKGVEVNHVNYVAEPTPTIYAAGKSAWWGPDVRLSRDFGETWEEPAASIRFAEGRNLSVERIWLIKSDTRAGRSAIYVGVDPGALFRSTDGGESWTELEALTDHPTRDQWMPGAGGLMVHSLCFDGSNPERIYAGISAAGVFRSDDGGATWTPKNQGVRADFMPDKFPEVGQCVHHLAIHPGNSQVLYQQNHCGVYRTENAGEEWIDICEGLPSRFGFPLAVHPHDGDTIYVVPEESDECRLTPDGAFRVYRSKNRGNTWEALTDGLPQVNAYQNVLRMALTTDKLDATGVYVGTQGGQVVASFDSGDHWTLLFDWLPPIYSVEAAIIER